MGLLLFLDFLPLLPVDGISAANEVVSAGLEHTNQSTEQSEHCGCGLPVDVALYLFQQRGGIFIAMTGGCLQPRYAHFQILRHTLSEAIDFAKLILGIWHYYRKCHQFAFDLDPTAEMSDKRPLGFLQVTMLSQDHHRCL